MALSIISSISDDYLIEIKRKLIHLSSLWMPIGIYLLPQFVVAGLVLSLLILVLLFEWLRQKPYRFSLWINRQFGVLLRHHEQAGFQLTGASYLLISALLCILVFNQVTAMAALVIIVIGDTAASLIGKRYGRVRLLGTKSLEGSIAFAVSAYLSVMVVGYFCAMSGLFYIISLAVVGVATIAELFCNKLKLDDNFIVPLVGASLFWLCGI